MSLVRTIAAAAALTFVPLLGLPGVPTPAASAGQCTVVGTSDDDVLVGTRGRDVICGKGGDDVLRGRRGQDLLVGGQGDDRLVGGRGVDWQQGGPGVDSCRYDEADWELSSCIFDRRPPRLLSITATPSVVDVTDAAATVIVSARLDDDTAVDGSWPPYFSLTEWNLSTSATGHDLDRVSGTRRNGLWQARVTIPQGFPPAELRVTLQARDPAGHHFEYQSESPLVTVDDAEPDLVDPEVELLSPATGATYDVRQRDRNIVVRARITDEQSGVASATFCVYRTVADGSSSKRGCDYQPSRLTGTAHDGVWEGTIRLPRATPGGDASVLISARDRARPWDGDTPFYVSRREAARSPSDVRYTGAEGDLTVIGGLDNAPPVLVSYAQSPSETAGPVDFSVSVEDETGATAVFVELWRRQSAQNFERLWGRVELHLQEGTAQDGTWAGLRELSQFPRGDYYPVVHVVDRTHVRTWVGESLAPLRIEPVDLLDGDPYVTLTW